MRIVKRWTAVLWCTLALFPTTHASAQKRVALAVGIDVYDNLPPLEQLQKAVNDARAVGAAFKELGFETSVGENLPRLAFTRAWQRFLNGLGPGDTAALFFAGHGVEIAGLNYLLPRDVPKVAAGEDQVLAEGSIRLNTLMENLRDRKVRVSLLIIDACRDNPFRDGSGRSVGGTRGLARIEAPEGSFVMYSAGVGEQALDRLPRGADTSPNSVYTRTLLPLLKTPGLSLQDVALRVREEVVDVARNAGAKQTPAYYDQLVGKLVLKPGPLASAAAPASAGQTPAEMARFCQSVAANPSLAVVESLLAANRGTPMTPCIEARIAELKKLALAASQAPAPAPPPPAPSPAPDAGSQVAPGLQRKPLKPRGQPVPLQTEEERALQPGDSFQECASCPEMMVLPAGSFMMGSSASEIGTLNKEAGGDFYSDEGPQRRVTIARLFAVGKFEVTFAEWDACVAERGCTLKPGDQGWGRGKHPVMNVSWGDVTQQYLPWLSNKTGKTYRLLTEAEWEYAARAGSRTRYHFGDSALDLCLYGNGTDEAAKEKSPGLTAANCRDGYANTAPVGSLRPNAFGLYDMHGNVWEWVQDCYHGAYNGAPSDGSAWTAGDCSRRVVRGGSMVNPPRNLRSASRLSASPGARTYGVGVRVARMLAP